MFCGGMGREVGGKGCGLEEGERRTGESRVGGISRVAGRGTLPIRRAKALMNARRIWECAARYYYVEEALDKMSWCCVLIFMMRGL